MGNTFHLVESGGLELGVQEQAPDDLKPHELAPLACRGDGPGAASAEGDAARIVRVRLHHQEVAARLVGSFRDAHPQPHCHPGEGLVELPALGLLAHRGLGEGHGLDDAVLARHRLAGGPHRRVGEDDAVLVGLLLHRADAEPTPSSGARYWSRITSPPWSK